MSFVRDPDQCVPRPSRHHYRRYSRNKTQTRLFFFLDRVGYIHKTITFDGVLENVTSLRERMAIGEVVEGVI